MKFAWVGILLAAAACGGSGDDDDDDVVGACGGGSYSMAWPSEQAPQFCMYPWDTSKDALELTECGTIAEDCSTTGPTPDFSCIDNPTPIDDLPAEPSTASLTGFVDVFSSGPDSDGARLYVYRASHLADTDDFDSVSPIATFDITLDALALADARACPQSRDFLQGACVLPTDDCTGCDKVIDATTFCYEGTCEALQRWEVRYTVDNIPTNEFLVLRTVGLDGSGNPQVLGNTWTQLVQYNVFLRTDERSCTDGLDDNCLDTAGATPLYRTNVNVISSQDYGTIPTSAGLSAGITAGHGAIAGEVHDCNQVRVQHAQIAFSVTPRVLVYFNGNPVKTLPRLQQIARGTNTMSLYSGLDIEPGEIDVAAVGVVDGALREIGHFTARVWPDSVTTLGLGDGRPAQP